MSLSSATLPREIYAAFFNYSSQRPGLFGAILYMSRD